MTIEQLFIAGRLEKVDSATVEAARLLAVAVDSSPENANLWRQYREELLELRSIGAADRDDFDEMLDSLHRDAALRHRKEPEA